MNIKFHIFEGKNSCQVSIFKTDLFFMSFTFRKIPKPEFNPYKMTRANFMGCLCKCLKSQYISFLGILLIF